jgi:hypothetical protein
MYPQSMMSLKATKIIWSQETLTQNQDPKSEENNTAMNKVES